MPAKKPFIWVENWTSARIANLDTPCWECVSHTLAEGYVSYGGTSAHRYLYQELFGRINNPKVVVRHRCDNRACLNPEHWESGTQKDNIDDCVKRGRMPRGEKSGKSKLMGIIYNVSRNAKLSGVILRYIIIGS